MPTRNPNSDPTMPMSSASISTDRMICQRLAPIARSSASSCVRCDTMIENVFRIRNTPTSSATAPKPRKK